MPTSAESKLTQFLRKTLNEEMRNARRTRGYIEDDIHFVDEIIDNAEKAKTTNLLHLARALKSSLDYNLITGTRFLLSLGSLVSLSSSLDLLEEQVKQLGAQPSKRIDEAKKQEAKNLRKIAMLYKKRRKNRDPTLYI